MDCTIVNFYPGTLMEPKPGVIPNMFIVKGARSKDEFTITHISDAKYQTDPVDGRPSIFVPILAEEIAQSIVQDFLLSKIGVEPEGKGPGIFFVKGVWTKEQVSVKFPKELEKAKTLQNEWFLDQVLVADTDWARKRSHLTITQDAKWAATWLGLEKDWNLSISDLVKQKTTKTCPGCAYEIPIAALVCRDCKTIQDPEKYKGLKVAS